MFILLLKSAFEVPSKNFNAHVFISFMIAAPASSLIIIISIINYAAY